MPPPNDDDDQPEMGPPSKRPREAQSTSSSVGQWAAAAERQMTAAQLLEGYNDPWSYSSKQLEIVKTRSKVELNFAADALWAQTSWQISARVHVDESEGIPDLVKRCAVTHDERKSVNTQSAHLVPARWEVVGGRTVYRGRVDIDLLKRAQVVPPDAHINSQANRIQLITEMHQDVDSRRLDFLPNQDQVIARLLCEIKYQAERAAAASGGGQGPFRAKMPARPPFDMFYDAAEKTGACFRLIASHRRASPYLQRYTDRYLTTDYVLEGITSDDSFRLVWPAAETPSPDKPLLPSIIEPASFNLLIWAVHDRIERYPPYSEELQQETSILANFVKLLLVFWFLKEDTPVEKVKALVERSRMLIQQQGGPGWTQQLEKLGEVSFTDILDAVTLPANALHSRNPRPSPEQQALMRQIAAAQDDGSISSDDLSELDFPHSALPHLHDLASLPLTTTAINKIGIDAAFDASGPDKDVTTPPLTHAASSCPSTTDPSSPRPVFASLAEHAAQHGKQTRLSSWVAGGPYPPVEPRGG